MENKQKSLRVSEVTIDRVLSHYLWNTAMLPKKENMASLVTSTNRNLIKIDATDYIKMVQTNMLYWNFLQAKRSSEKFQTTLIIN